MKNLYLILFLITTLSYGQVSYNANGNNGFGGAVGQGSISINDNGTTITCTLTRGAGNFNDNLVMYIDNGSAGRSVIDGNVNDANDANRRAISNVGSGNITFPAGFEATHAVSINTGFGGLWSIPATGTIGNNGLSFVDGVGTPPSATFTTFAFSFDWTEIGLGSTDNFSFVITYGNPNDAGSTLMFSSDEAFGGGVAAGNPGAGAFSYTTYFDYPSGDVGGLAESASGGNWSSASTWVNGNVPLSGDEIIINPLHFVTLDQDANVSGLTISEVSGNAGGLFFGSNQGRLLEIRDGGSLINNGTFQASDGTVSFLGEGNVDSSPFTILFENVIIAGGVNFGTNAAIDGDLTIETGGFVDTNPPVYNTDSTLIYSDDNNTYGRGLEWSAATGAGYPYDVIIRDNTTLQLGANGGTGTARQCAGNLTVDAGSTLTLAAPDMTETLTVLGNFSNNGTVTLSGAVGGDLVLQGNFSDNGAFNSNNRAVFFNGVNLQTIASTTDPLTIDFIIIDKPLNNLQMLQNLDLPNNLEMTQGNLDLNGNTLTISGDIRPNDGAGTIIGNAAASTLVFDNQSTARTLEVGDLQNNEITNLTFNESAGVTVNTDLKVTGTFDINAGENSISSTSVLDVDGAALDVALGAGFTFESDSNGTAQIETISLPGSINGDVTVERYIPARRAYRILTTSLNNAGSINANWQENAITTALGNGNPNPGFGTHITGGTTTNGFDQNETGAPSMFTFNNSFVPMAGQTQDDAWSQVDNTLTTNLSAGKPFLTFVRGDRSTDLTLDADPATETTLRATGDIHTGPLTFDLSAEHDFYSLVGNPYQAVVDFNQVDTDDLTDFIYIWDTTVGTRGGYVSVELPLGNNDILPPVPGTSDASQFIPPGASLFVQNLPNGSADITGTFSPTLTFNEDDKNTAGSQASIFSSYPHLYINSRLYKTSDLQSGSTESDAIGLRFSSDFNTPGNNDEDATKLINPDENYAIVNNGLRSIDKQDIPQLGHEVNLSITNFQETNYSLTFVMENKPTGLGVFIEDKYLNTQTELTDTFVYDFTVDTSIPESIAEDRFSLIFDNTTLGLEDNSFGSDFRLYPNPAPNGQYSINTPNLSGEVRVEMTNLLGQRVYSKTLTATGNQVDVNAPNLTQGVYVVKLTQDNQSFSTKLIVE